MTTINHYRPQQIQVTSPHFSAMKATIETAFYGNNVSPVMTRKTAYHLAQEDPGVITTDISVAHSEALGLPDDAMVLVSNDGAIVGRTARARTILPASGPDRERLLALLREAVFAGSKKQWLKTDVLVGLDAEFSRAAHLMLPVTAAENLYLYLMNFLPMTMGNHTIYQDSKHLDANDIFLYADPDWQDPDFPDGLVLFDQETNVAAVLGLRYFGELKKATLTLAWATAHRLGYVAAHGGLKQYDQAGEQYTLAVFGLSGSGKSTITLADHDPHFKMRVLHDDAFVIDRINGQTTALEPSYFDKTQDYPSGHPGLQDVVAAQNVGVTLDLSGQKVLVTSDIRNGNGRAIKSQFATPNRVNHIAAPLNAIFWIMKDESLPPVIRLNDPMLATIFGLTLATKRSSAENVSVQDRDKLVYVPFANPFRIYPLTEEFQDFFQLFDTQNIEAYVLNTGYFREEKVRPADTLDAISTIVKRQGIFKAFDSKEQISYLETAKFNVPLQEELYRAQVVAQLSARLAQLDQWAKTEDPLMHIDEATRKPLETLIASFSS